MFIRMLAIAALLSGGPFAAAQANVAIDETFDSLTGTGGFTVHVDATDPVLDIGWFAVVNHSAGSANAERFGWTGTVITAAEWAGGYSFYIFGKLDTTDYPWPELTSDPDGRAFLYHAIYLGGGVGGSDIAAGTSQAGFTFDANFAGSPWIAGNGIGNVVVYGGTTAAVPLPPMLPALALASIGIMRRSRRRCPTL